MTEVKLTLPSDEIDDLIYFSRAGDLESLKESIQGLSKSHSCSAQSVITSAIDVDEDGLGSASCLLHYPAANGNLEVVIYLLSVTSAQPVTPLAQDGDSATAKTTLADASISFVNHQNVSGNTPLHWAGMNGHLPIVQVLIKAGADPEIVNGAGRDAVVESEWSSKEGATECAVWILKECGALEKGLGQDTTEGDSSERMDVDAAETESPSDVNGDETSHTIGPEST